jgi:hypothetical protein
MIQSRDVIGCTLSLIFALLAIAGVALYSAHDDFNKPRSCSTSFCQLSPV